MINDRKMVKWQGAFLMPEHIKSLKNEVNNYYKTARPLLDESQIEEMEQVISESLVNKTILEITTWKEGYFNTRVGIIQKIDPYTKKIHLLDELNTNIIIDFYEITNTLIK